LYASFKKDPTPRTNRYEKIEKYITPGPGLYDFKKKELYKSVNYLMITTICLTICSIPTVLRSRRYE
jgi:hypothetical protein